MAYYMEGITAIGVLIDFDLATYPEEMVIKILGLSRNDEKTELVGTDADTTIDLTDSPGRMTNSIPYPTGACQDRSGTTPFMAIETLDLKSSGYKHHLSHDLESIFYASVWQGVGYKYDQKQYPMIKVQTDNGEKEVDLLRSWRIGSWDAVVKEKEIFLSSSSETTRYILDEYLTTTCGGLARLFHRRRSALKEAAEESKQWEKTMNLYKKLMSGDGGNVITNSSDITTWASRQVLNPSERRSAPVSKPLDPIYPAYAEHWFLFDLDDCEKNCCRHV